jgi:DnaJ-class molecular chaperone
MPFKKIEDMDFYEILDLNRDAAPEDISAAYRRAVSAYEPGALASYGLVSNEERILMLEKIEGAYLTLGDPELRARYDEDASRGRGPAPQRAVFRKTVQLLDIQDIKHKPRFVDRVRRFFRGKSNQA